MFAKAVKASRPTATPAKSSKTVNKPVDLIPGWGELCAIDACMKALKGLLELKKAAIVTAATEHLVARGTQRKGKPDALALAEGQAAGSAYVRRRDVRSPLTGEELELLAGLVGAESWDGGIPGFAETIETAPAMLAVNPAYANDELLLKRIDKALSGVKGIPEDFILQVDAETKTVVTDTAMDRVFAIDPENVAEAFALLGGVTLKPVFKDVEAAWDIVRPLLGEEEPAAAPLTAIQKTAAKGKLMTALKASLAAEEAAA